ncbi:MAG TPA: aldehyde ferredoxin oxidoreductase C-terminal domain-containing protein [Desulfotignum sp.]|nr:aldehyde ferredoxin oxidoreductase C-terminal domain-containing protein [Desulfotignum sp.]
MNTAPKEDAASMNFHEKQTPKPQHVSDRFGTVLTADLTTGECRYDPYPDAAIDFLGGRGFNAWYLYHHLKPGTDPLGPDNILLLSTGLLTGSAAPCGARLHINALSPLTGILGSSNIGGYTGAWLRSCNLASVIVTGAATEPVYLYVHENTARLVPAQDLWGLDTFAVQDRIRQNHVHENIRILTIGPAGENRVRFAAVMTEKDHAAGRTGMGAVMGAKNLKAIVIARGTRKHLPADTPQKKLAVKTYAALVRHASEFSFFSRYGGSGYLQWVNDFGIMGAKNYNEIGMTDISPIDGRKLADKIVKTSGCFKCPIQCKADLVMDPAKPDEVSTRPEFEPVINFGPKCGLADMAAIVRLDNLCNRLGLDTTSTASVIAFAMDLAEKGLMPADLKEDLDLSWGNARTMETLIHRIAGRTTKLGRLLARGVRHAADQIGPGAAACAAHVKGLELTAYHPKAIMGTALGYAVSSRGGDYNNVYASLEYSWSKEQALKEFGTIKAVDIHATRAKGWLIKKAVVTNILVDCLGLCKVPVLSLLKSFNLEPEIALVNALADTAFTREDLMAAGEQIAALERRFNLRHTALPLVDHLPDRFFSFKDNPAGLTRETLTAMLAEFYHAMGWDINGVPPDPARAAENVQISAYSHLAN